MTMEDIEQLRTDLAQADADVETLQGILRLLQDAAQSVIDASLTLPNVAAVPQPLRQPLAHLALSLVRTYKR